MELADEPRGVRSADLWRRAGCSSEDDLEPEANEDETRFELRCRMVVIADKIDRALERWGEDAATYEAVAWEAIQRDEWAPRGAADPKTEAG